MNIYLFRKAFRDHWKSLLAWGLVIVFMVTVQLSVYPTIVNSGEGAKQFIDAYPEAFKEIFRMEDYTSGPGFLSTELFSLMLPLVLIGVAATWGAAATAEEEETGTADILFTLPISRGKILVSSMIATASALACLALVAFTNIYLGSNPVDLEVKTDRLAEATFSCLLLGIFFAGIAFLLGALTGRKGLSLGITAGFAVIAFVFFSLAPLVSTFEFLTPFNPFQWAIGENQLANGADWIGMLKLIAGSGLLHVAAVFSFDRREIHS